MFAKSTTKENDMDASDKFMFMGILCYIVTLQGADLGIQYIVILFAILNLVFIIGGLILMFKGE